MTLFTSAYLLLLDHFICPRQHRRRDRQAEGFGGLQIDHEFELRRLLHRQVGRLGALQDLVHVDRRAAIVLHHVGAVTQQATGLDGDALKLEITESAMVDADASDLVMRRIRAMGIRLAVDDFGTGYSGLSQQLALEVNAFAK